MCVLKTVRAHLQRCARERALLGGCSTPELTASLGRGRI